ncbi:MAG: hypothetical protein ABI361_13160 [Nitrososphaera sp.]|jgi:archaellum component FlaC
MATQSAKGRITKGQHIRDMYTRGKSHSEIAKELGVSIEYVNNETRRLRKLGNIAQPPLENSALGEARSKDTTKDTVVSSADKRSDSPIVQSMDKAEQNDTASRKRRSAAFELFEQGFPDLDVAIKLELSESELSDFRRQYLTLKGRHEEAELYALEPERVRAIRKLEERMEEEKIDPILFFESMKNRRLVDYTNRKLEELNNHLKMSQQEIEIKVSEKEQISKQCSELDNRIEQGEERLHDLENKIHSRMKEFVQSSKELSEAKGNLERIERAYSLKGRELVEIVKESINKPKVEDMLIQSTQNLLVNPEIRVFLEHSKPGEQLDGVPYEKCTEISNAWCMIGCELVSLFKDIVVKAIEQDLEQTPQTPRTAEVDPAKSRA